MNPFALARVRAAVRQFRPDVALVGMVEQHLSPAVFAAVTRRADDAVPRRLQGRLPDPFEAPARRLALPRPRREGVHAGRVRLPPSLVARPSQIRPLSLRGSIGSTGSVACSEWLRDALANEGIESEVLILPTPPPSSGYARTPAAHPLFLFVGRLDREKGVDRLLHAFGRVVSDVPAARLRLAGDGEERVRARAPGLLPRRERLGRLPRAAHAGRRSRAS